MADGSEGLERVVQERTRGHRLTRRPALDDLQVKPILGNPSLDKQRQRGVAERVHGRVQVVVCDPPERRHKRLLCCLGGRRSRNKRSSAFSAKGCERVFWRACGGDLGATRWECVGGGGLRWWRRLRGDEEAAISSAHPLAEQREEDQRL